MTKRFEVAVLAFPVVCLCAGGAFAQEAGSSASSTEPASTSADVVQGPDLGSGHESLAPRSFDPGRSLVDAPTGDGRRTLGAFPRNFARGVVGVFSRDSVTPFLLGGGLALAGSTLDGRTSRALLGSCLQCGHTGASIGGSAAVPMVGALFLAGRFSPQGRFRAATYDFAQAMLVNAVWTGAFKYTLRRQRPDGSDNLSLPSGHTSNTFALATVANAHYGWKVGLPAFALASAVGLSRVESNRHYLSDVLAGATIGVLVGRTVTRVDSEAPARRRTFALTPSTDARGGGVGLGLAASW